MIEWSYLGDSCLTGSVGQDLDRRTCWSVLRIYGRIKEDPELSRLGLLDVVPAYTSFALYFDPTEADIEGLQQRVEGLVRDLEARPEEELQSLTGGAVQEIPVVYDGEDLDRIASVSGLSTAGVVVLHTRPRYTVAMIGFLPHFPYLIGLDKRLATPRLSNPRTKVPAGAVAIGGEQTGIYPKESPGGWNIIGRTDPALLQKLRPGDTVVFREVPRLAEEGK